jgi:acetylornithine deacetylase/succinyl-diaminopimelate desuccinylase-like protein
VVLSRGLREALIGSAKSQGIDYLEMPSGAVHDALEVARITDAAMVFVPSIGGRSHCPEEDTSYESVALGVDVLAGAVQKVGEGSA